MGDLGSGRGIQPRPQSVPSLHGPVHASQLVIQFHESHGKLVKADGDICLLAKGVSPDGMSRGMKHTTLSMLL